MFESIVVVVPETVKFCPIVTLPEASIVIASVSLVLPIVPPSGIVTFPVPPPWATNCNFPVFSPKI